MKNIGKRSVFSGLVLAGIVSPCAADSPPGDTAGRPDRPNILWIITEDISPNLGCYGDPDAKTPVLDRLAARGVHYTAAFSVAGVCAPSRSSIITGMYASSLGSHPMRSTTTLPKSVDCFTAYLRQAGYYCTNGDKQDYNFVAPPDAWDESAKKAHWRNRRPGQPFFHIAGISETHESFLRAGDETFARVTHRLTAAQRHDPAKVTLPPWLPDTPAVRREWARYHDLITTMDYKVADCLAQLEADGLADDTIVFFLSDHGAGLPRAKQFIFDAGLHVPLVAYFPEKWRHLAPGAPGRADNRLISFVDLAPTMLSLAGVRIPDHMQGVAFLGKAQGEPRRYVHGIRDRMDERVDMNRTVRDERFKYHRNYMPHLPHFPWLTYMELLDTSVEFRRLKAEGRLSGGLAYFMADHQSLEELYDLWTDPGELHNLAADPRYADQLQRLRSAHFQWSLDTFDTAFIPEQMLRDLAAGSSEYDYAHSKAYRLDRCIATARLIERGESALPDLVKALGDDYGPVRYWAATGLVTLGAKAVPARPALLAALDDVHPEVAIAAAEALCRIGEPAPALPVLAKYLRHQSPFVSIAAANVADRIDEQARPIIEVMRQETVSKRGGTVISGSNNFLMAEWALLRALKELGEDSPDPLPRDAH